MIQAAEQESYAWLEQQAPRLTQRHSPHDLRAHRMQLARSQPEIAHDLTELRLRSLAMLSKMQAIHASSRSMPTTCFARHATG